MKISAGFPTFTVLLVVYCMFKGLPDSWMLYGLFALESSETRLCPESGGLAVFVLSRVGGRGDLSTRLGQRRTQVGQAAPWWGSMSATTPPDST